jgi:putative DNA primase/helicase
MAKSRKWTDPNLPVWFDGTNINEAVFCDEFLSSTKSFLPTGLFSRRMAE